MKRYASPNAKVQIEIENRKCWILFTVTGKDPSRILIERDEAAQIIRSARMKRVS